MTAPTTFETPVVTSEARPIVIHQNLPKSSAFGGGHFQLYALQLRYAVTDRLGIIATKDGYINFNPKLARDEDGFADVAAGVKYAAVSDSDLGLLVTPGIIYEIDTGDHEVFQGNGDGLVRPFVSAALDLDDFNVIASVGLNIPVHGGQETKSVDYHLHVDYEIEGVLSPLAELNGITYYDDGRATAFNFEGGDLINLGSSNVDGQSVISAAFGGRYELGDAAHLGAAYEFPVSGRRDLLRDRITVDLIWTF